MYELQETTQDPKTTTKNRRGLNLNPCGSYPLQPSSDPHNPLKLEPNLQTHMLAYPNAKTF